MEKIILCLLSKTSKLFRNTNILTMIRYVKAMKYCPWTIV